MQTRNCDYDSPLDSVEESEGEVEDSSVLPVVLDNPPSVPNPPHLSDCPSTWGTSSFDDMDDCGGGSVAMRDLSGTSWGHISLIVVPNGTIVSLLEVLLLIFPAV